MSAMPKIHETDARTVRSREQLKSALLAILAGKAFHQIRTKEIAERAGINRVTFYDHFATKEELLDELIDDVMTEYAEIIESSARITVAQLQPVDVKRAIQLSVHHIKKHAQFYTIMFFTNGVPDLANRLHDQMRRSLSLSFSRMMQQNPEEDVDLFIDWVIGGAIGIYRYWLQNGLRQSEAEIAKHMLRVMEATSQVFHPRKRI